MISCYIIICENEKGERREYNGIYNDRVEKEILKKSFKDSYEKDGFKIINHNLCFDLN